MGIILLLFVVDMEFPIEKLRRIGKKALTIVLSEALGTFSIGFSVSFFICISHFLIPYLLSLKFPLQLQLLLEGIRRTRHNQIRSIQYNFRSSNNGRYYYYYYYINAGSITIC